MSTSTTAYLFDGRQIDVPHASVQDWQYEVSNGDTTLSLADWYTEHGEQNTEEIQGSVEDTAKCGETGFEHEEHIRRVTNAGQIGEYKLAWPHASVWVCGRKTCLLDALAWVERTTGEKAVWTEDAGQSWNEPGFPQGTVFAPEDHRDYEEDNA